MRHDIPLHWVGHCFVFNKERLWRIYWTPRDTLLERRGLLPWGLGLQCCHDSLELDVSPIFLVVCRPKPPTVLLLLSQFTHAGLPCFRSLVFASEATSSARLLWSRFANVSVTMFMINRCTFTSHVERLTISYCSQHVLTSAS